MLKSLFCVVLTLSLHSAILQNNAHAGKNNSRSGLKTDLVSLVESIKNDSLEVFVKKAQNSLSLQLSDSDGLTPLHWAVKTNSLSKAEFLIQSNVPINAVDQTGKTPLHLAAEEGITDLIALLMSNGANPSLRDHQNESPFDIATRNEFLDCAQIMATDREDLRTDLFFTYLDKNEIEGAANLLALGIDLGKFHDGFLPLGFAIKSGALDIARKILALKIDVNLGDAHQHTALDIAILSEQIDIIPDLLARGADLRKHCKSGMTALHHAAERGVVSILSLLLDAGADVHSPSTAATAPTNLPAFPGLTALHLALARGHTSAIELLLLHGADKHRKTQNGYTPLIYTLMFAERPQRDALLSLVKHGFFDFSQELMASQELIEYFESLESYPKAALEIPSYILDLRMHTRKNIKRHLIYREDGIDGASVTTTNLERHPWEKLEEQAKESCRKVKAARMTEQCPICLDKLSNSGMITRTACNHIFCTDCLERNYHATAKKSVFSCALCRKNLVDTNLYEVAFLSQPLNEEVLPDFLMPPAPNKSLRVQIYPSQMGFLDTLFTPLSRLDDAETVDESTSDEEDFNTSSNEE